MTKAGSLVADERRLLVDDLAHLTRASWEMCQEAGGVVVSPEGLAILLCLLFSLAGCLYKYDTLDL